MERIFRWTRRTALVGSFLAVLPLMAAAAESVAPAKPAEFRRSADTFIAAAKAADTARMLSSIGPAVLRRSGPENVERYLNHDVAAFFRTFEKVGSSISVSRVTDAHGLTYYMYKQGPNGELSPFVIQLVQDGASIVVTNIIVDRFVEGRHCKRVAAAWHCPSFQ